MIVAVLESLLLIAHQGKERWEAIFCVRKPAKRISQRLMYEVG